MTARGEGAEGPGAHEVLLTAMAGAVVAFSRERRQRVHVEPLRFRPLAAHSPLQFSIESFFAEPLKPERAS